MPFKLHSSFKPTGDQPQAIDNLVASVNSGSKHQTLLGVTGSGKTFTLANVINKIQRPTLIISHNKTLAAQLYQEFRDFFPTNAVSYFVSYYDYYQPEAYLPSTDTYIEKETQINDEIDKLRLSSTTNLLSRPDVIVVASVSCIYNLGSPVIYGKNQLELIAGEILDRSTLIKRLTEMQYTRLDLDVKRGSFRIQGENLSLWPADQEYILKIIFLDNIIESITPLHPVSGADLSKPDFPPNHRYIIYPAKHYQSGQQSPTKALSAIKADLKKQIQYFQKKGQIVEAYRLSQRVKHDLQMIQELGYVNGIENYSRYFDNRQQGDPPYSLIDYFSYNIKKFKQPSFLTVIDESHITLPQLRGMYHGDQSRKQVLIDYGFRLPSALDNRPLTYTELQARLPQIIYSSATPSDEEIQLSEHKIFEQLIRPTGLIEPEISVRPINGQVADLIQEIDKRLNLHERVLVTTLTKRTAEALTEFLNNPTKIQSVLKSNSPLTRLPKVQYLHADVNTLDRQDILDSLRQGDYDVLIGINLLREGLDLPEVSLVAIFEADKEGFLRSKTSLIQTMGRAARHVNGQVIMYADNMTASMQSAIDEVSRRRRIQLTYNRQHHIDPQSINKPIRTKLINRELMTSPPLATGLPTELKPYGWQKLSDINPDLLTPSDRQKLIHKFTRLMNQSAKNWDFEQAVIYRNLITMLESTV